jgi:hypothetical membrane protein
MANGTAPSGPGTKVPFEAIGIAGCAIIGVCCLIAAIGFTGYAHEGYSMLNHMISELGMASESPLAWVFNIGLMVGSVAIILFIWSTRVALPSRLGGLARLLGIASGIGGFFVGVFPADGIIVAHGFAAMTFFFGGATTVVIFSLAIARQHDAHLGKWLCIAGIGVTACFAAFIIDMFVTTSGANFSDADAIEALATFRPPVFWSMAFLEWLPLIGVLAWLSLAAIDSLARNSRR